MWYTVMEGVVVIGGEDPNEDISLSPAGLCVTLGGVFVEVPGAGGGPVRVEELECAGTR
jgi:hypothetical protein